MPAIGSCGRSPWRGFSPPPAEPSCSRVLGGVLESLAGSVPSCPRGFTCALPGADRTCRAPRHESRGAHRTHVGGERSEDWCAVTLLRSEASLSWHRIWYFVPCLDDLVVAGEPEKGRQGHGTAIAAGVLPG